MFKTRVLLLSLVLSLVSVMGNSYAQESPSDEEIMAQIMEATAPIVIESIVSNNALFTAEVVAYPCTLFSDTLSEYSLEFLSIQNAETSETIWQTQQLINCGGLGTYGFDPIRWVDNYLYYSTDREGSVHGFAINWTPPLFRYDVSNLSDTSESLGFALISPLGRYLVSWQEQTVSIGEANSPDNVSIELENDTLGITNVLWLPDESGVLVIQADASPQFQFTQSLVTYVERETMEQSQLLATPE